MSGGKGGGGSKKQKVEIKQEPLKYGPYSADVLSKLYGYTGDLLGEPLLPQAQRTGLEGIIGQAQSGGELVGPATGAVGDVIGGGGLAAPAAGLAGDLIGGEFVNPAFAETRRIAEGGDVGANPYLEATYERASRPLLQNLTETVNPAIDIGAASSGRLGSGMHALLRNRAGEETTRGLTDLATGLYGGAYESERGRQMGALGQLAGLGQQDVTNRLAGAGLFDVGTARTLGAAGMAPGLDQARFADAERLLRLPYGIGGEYANIAGAFPVQGGGSTQTSSIPGVSPVGQGLSGALGGAASGAMIGSVVPGLGTGIGALIGGGLGLGAGLLSDVRAKDEIEPVGITFGGHGVYRYRYKDDPGGPMMMGVLAQEVAQDQPEAVYHGPDGMLRVLYEHVD